MSSDNVSPEPLHRRLIEPRAALFAVMTTLCVSVGGLVEITPMFTALGPAPLEGVTPHTPLEVAGRDIYVREGCYVCHSQWVRPMRSETMRYGEWSRAGEYVYDRPFQLGSRRIGPDLQRVGGKYPDGWHYDHMRDPRSVSPASVMPPYPWLYEAKVDPADVTASLVALKRAGTPYTDADIAAVPQSLRTQQDEIVARLSTAGAVTEPDTEIVALIAYLQRLGVDGKRALAKSEGGAQ